MKKLVNVLVVMMVFSGMYLIARAFSGMSVRSDRNAPPRQSESSTRDKSFADKYFAMIGKLKSGSSTPTDRSLTPDADAKDIAQLETPSAAVHASAVKLGQSSLSSVDAKAAAMPVPVKDALPKSERTEQIHEFLNKRRLDNPTSALGSAKINAKLDENTAKLSGQYIGVLEASEDGSRLKIQAKISVASTPVGAASILNGRFGDDSGNAKKFAATTPIRTVQGSDGQSSGTILTVSPTSYLQMFYMPSTGLWVGNYYSSAKTGQYALVGTTRLARAK